MVALFIVKMIAGRSSSATDFANFLASFDVLTILYAQGIEMSVTGFMPLSICDNNFLTVSLAVILRILPASLLDSTRARGFDGRAFGSGDVDALVRFAFA
jgi:hypothetical protein